MGVHFKYCLQQTGPDKSVQKGTGVGVDGGTSYPHTLCSFLVICQFSLWISLKKCAIVYGTYAQINL